MAAGVDRLAGFREALAAEGLEEVAVEDGDFTTDGGMRAMERIIDSGVEFDGLFIASDLMAQGAVEVLRRTGRRVPEDVAVVGFDDSPIAVAVQPALTTMRQPSLQQGEQMAGVLLDLLAGRNPPHATILGTELVVRDST